MVPANMLRLNIVPGRLELPCSDNAGPHSPKILLLIRTIRRRTPIGNQPQRKASVTRLGLRTCRPPLLFSVMAWIAIIIERRTDAVNGAPLACVFWRLRFRSAAEAGFRYEIFLCDRGCAWLARRFSRFGDAFSAAHPPSPSPRYAESLESSV